jgi:hypothetical protein
MIIGAMLINLLTRSMKSSFYNPDCSYQLFMLRYNDIFKNKKTTLSQKIWAQKRGFLSDSISFYGLTEDNYQDYLSDFDYFQLHPINGAFSHWIDDKLTIKYILKPYSEFLPEYYYQVFNKEILRLSDCPEGYGQTPQDVINLLKAKGLLAAKLISGSRGKGFLKLAYEDHNYFVNNHLSSAREIDEIFVSWLEMKNEEYLITEYLKDHKDLQKISIGVPSPLRIIVIREMNNSPRIIYSNIFFATRKSGITTIRGGVGCMVDIQTGFYSDGIIPENGKIIDCKCHPDTNVLLRGVLPNWSLIKREILEISSYIPQVRYMGFDIIITDDGFKIIEMNSHSSISVIQYYYPFLKDESSKEFFSTLIREKKARIKS